jgi:RNA polymerase sigma-70 factor (ECF subfamily)
MWPDSSQTQILLARARQGESSAVNELLDRHREALRRMIDLRMDRMIQRRVDASDIVQDVLVEANRRLAEYLKSGGDNTAPMPFHLWLRHIARDRLIDAHRRHRQAARRSIDRELPVSQASPPAKSPTLPVSHSPPLPFTAAGGNSSFDALAQFPDPELTPAAAATWHELERRFLQALETLEEQDQEVILMRHFEHLSNTEVAQALNLSDAAAGMRYLRAMRKLRALLDEPAE